MIYRRQIHKKGMTLQTVEGEEDDQPSEINDDKAFQAYFGNDDLKQLFEFKENCHETRDLIL
jgi:hypothetical protein